MSEKRFGHVSIPFKRIHLELTNVCDFNCTFCPKGIMTRKYGYMDTDLARRAVSEIKAHGLAEKVTLHVMGEPTLHPDFFSVLDHCAAEEMPVGLTTNGGGLGGPIGERLLDYKLHQVDVSLQTPDRESFALRKARRIGFDDYLANLMEFFTQYRARHPETIFKFRILNTVFPVKTIEKKNGPVRVINSSGQLREVLGEWTARLQESELGRVSGRAAARLKNIKAHRWYVLEVLPQVFLETYLLADWGHAFYDGPIKPAWAGYCDGMKNHFAVLHNGDVTLCCIDFDGKTAIGNLNRSSLEEILKSPHLGRIMAGFKRYKLVHPYCQRCLGGKNTLSWLLRPAATMLGLHVLRPYFYRHIRLFD